MVRATPSESQLTSSLRSFGDAAAAVPPPVAPAAKPSALPMTPAASTAITENKRIARALIETMNPIKNRTFCPPISPSRKALCRYEKKGYSKAMLLANSHFVHC
ncbi:hypothetical protein BHYA_0526g00040 [Botrytis hyacinthi]|uniref:Uncharacterized protein n=1 Tax=Botrytis hyacinthi TaxID=278943 RepID=A0A4Z1G808_9HELO|nr:hypothetical protein BHYA_0526g00040 [Botrytis hyacinthi]